MSSHLTDANSTASGVPAHPGAPDEPPHHLELPAAYAVADELALRSQRRHLRLVLTEVTALVLAALLSYGGTPFPAWSGAFGVAAAACLGVALAVQLVGYRAGWSERWFAARSLAETTLSAAWRYILRTAPFEADAHADQRLRRILAETQQASPALTRAIERLGPSALELPPSTRALRHAPWRVRAALYLRERLHDQQQWYAR
jgi:hypothetical protein